MRARATGTSSDNYLVDLAGLPGHVVHQQVLAKRIGSGEVRFSAAHFGDFLHEVDEAVVAREHKRVDKDSSALAFVHFFESLAHNERVQAERVFVNAAVL